MKIKFEQFTSKEGNFGTVLEMSASENLAKVAMAIGEFVLVGKNGREYRFYQQESGEFYPLSDDLVGEVEVRFV